MNRSMIALMLSSSDLGLKNKPSSLASAGSHLTANVPFSLSTISNTLTRPRWFLCSRQGALTGGLCSDLHGAFTGIRSETFSAMIMPTRAQVGGDAIYVA